jgi:hypothetical protein
MQSSEYDKSLQIIECVERHYHIVEKFKEEKRKQDKLVNYNNRLILSECVEFLKAIQSDIGGEIQTDQLLGTYLVLNSSQTEPAI